MKKQNPYDIESAGFSHLEEFESIDAGADWEKVRARIGFGRSRSLPAWQWIAASALILLGIGWISRTVVQSTREQIVSSLTQVMEVTLPDGSSVFLNRQSRLTFPDKFHRNYRQVALQGEGFFQISKDVSRPFRVIAEENAIVEVMGTSFNIDASGSNDAIEVQVMDGKVAFYPSGNEDLKQILGANEHATLKNGTIRKNNLTDTNFLSWKTGVLSFDQDSIETVVRQLSEHYDTSIALDRSVDPGLLLTTTIDNQNLTTVLEEIELILGVSCVKDDNRIILRMIE